MLHLHKHIENVKTNHNIYASDVIFLAKTRLMHSDDDDTYKIPGFEVSYRNDQLWNQTTRPPHGLISYVRDAFWILAMKHKHLRTMRVYFMCTT